MRFVHTGPVELVQVRWADGEALVKRAESAVEALRLEREAGFLKTADGIVGVPEVLEHERAGDRPSVVASLAVVAAAGPSLADARALDLLTVARTATSLARALAGLHERDLVHGAVSPDHVVLDGSGSVVLCGVAAGGRTGEPKPDEPGRALRSEDDVASWGDVVEHMLDDAVDVAESDPRAVRAELAARADDARRPDPAQRPAAHTLAAALEHRLGPVLAEVAVPDATGYGSLGSFSAPPFRRSARRRPGGLLDRLATPAETVPPAPSPPAPRSPGRWVAGASAGVAALFLVAVAPAVGERLRPERPRSGPVVASIGAPPCPPVPAPAADVDGDGCEEAVRWSAGVLSAGSFRFSLGRADDLVVVGDWDCDGRRTPVLLAGSDLVVFDAWPQAGGDMTGRVAATIPDALGLAVARSPDGCERPTVSRRGAPDLTVDVRP